jgi:hypothetical protein
VRIAFPALFQPQSFGEGEPAYSAKFIVPKDHPQIADLRTAMQKVAKEKWNDKAPGVLKLLIEDKKVAFVERDYLNKSGEPYDGFAGTFYLSTRSPKTKPSVFDAANRPVSESDGVVYSGCYVDASVEFYAQDNKYGRRVNCNIRGVRFVGHGEAFGGGAPAQADEFGEPVEAAPAEDFV